MAQPTSVSSSAKTELDLKLADALQGIEERDVDP